MKRATQFALILLSFLITGALLTACGQKESETLASKAHSNENLIQKECYVFDDGSSADHYERIYGYYFLSGTEDLLLWVDPIPEIWDYEEAISAMSQDARETLQKEIESLALYDLNQLLDRAYEDYCFCRDSDNPDDAFNHHVIFVDADVSVNSDMLICNFEISYAPEGHFKNELTSQEQSYSFDIDNGKLIA